MVSINIESINEYIGMYFYRGVIRLSPLGMIYNLSSVSACGLDYVKVNVQCQQMGKHDIYCIDSETNIELMD